MEDLCPDPVGKSASRKYKLALLSLGIIVVVTIASSLIAGLPSVLGELISGVLGVTALYYTGNVANKHVVGKQMVQINKKEEDKGDS